MVPGRPEVIGFDDYGFAIFAEDSLHRSEDQRCHEYHFNEQSNSDILSLQTMWDKLEKNFDQKCLVSPQKLRNFIKKGIPATLRGEFWQLLVGSKTLKNNTTFDYQEKLTEVRNIMVDHGVTEYDGKKAAMLISKLIFGSFSDEEITDEDETPTIDEETQKKLTGFRQILLDADRSFPSHQMFMEGTSKGKEGRAALFRILAVYTLYNPQVSYCQGMSYIAGMLLMNMCEEDAFWMLVSLFERPKYLTGYFDSSLSKIQRHSKVFERFLRQKMPKLYNHLKSNGIEPLLYITPWFMALFTSLPCWDSVLTIWDLLFLDGISVIFQASLAILHVLSDQLLALNDMSLILPKLLRLPPERIKRPRLIPEIWRWTVYSWEVDAVMAIISDSNTNTLVDSEIKRKALHDDNGSAKKKPRLGKENGETVMNQATEVIALQRKNPPSLFKKFTEYVVNLLPNSLKESASTNLLINSQREGGSSSSCFSFTGSAGSTSTAKGVPRLSPRKRCHRVATGNENIQMFQKLQVVSPVRRSPRIARLQSAAKSFNSPSTNEVVSSYRCTEDVTTCSPNAKHAFKMFNTPTPLRISQISKTPRVLDSLDSASRPHLSLSPDVELHNLDYD